MKTIQTKALFIALLLSIAAPSLPAEAEWVQQALWKAAKEGDLAVVEKTLASGADVNAKNKVDQTALILAAENGHLKVTKLLLENDANPDEEDKDGWTSLMVAAESGHLEIASLLIKSGAAVDARDYSGYTALMFALLSLRVAMVELLLENGVDITIKSQKGKTALEIAEQKGNTEIIEIMMPFVIEKIAITEEQRQKLAREQDGIDLISLDDITKEPLDKLMILEKHLFLRKTIMDHMISKVGSPEGILDPFTRKPIPTEIQLALVGYFSLPIKLLKREGPIYKDAADLQKRENLIVMTGEPETEEGKKELKELEDEAAEFRKRIRDTLASYNYSYAE